MFAIFTPSPCSHGQFFFFFLSCVNDCIESVAIFTTWAKINSVKYFCNARVAVLGEIFCPAKSFGCIVCTLGNYCTGMLFYWCLVFWWLHVSFSFFLLQSAKRTLSQLWLEIHDCLVLLDKQKYLSPFHISHFIIIIVEYVLCACPYLICFFTLSHHLYKSCLKPLVTSLHLRNINIEFRKWSSSEYAHAAQSSAYVRSVAVGDRERCASRFVSFRCSLFCYHPARRLVNQSWTPSTSLGSFRLDRATLKSGTR